MAYVCVIVPATQNKNKDFCPLFETIFLNAVRLWSGGNKTENPASHDTGLKAIFVLVYMRKALELSTYLYA